MFLLCGSYVNEDAGVAHRYATLGLSDVRYSSHFPAVAFVNQSFNLVPRRLQAWQEWSGPHVRRLPGHGKDVRLVSRLHIVLLFVLISPQPVPPW